MSTIPPLPRLKAAEKALADATVPFIPDLGLSRLSLAAGARSAGYSDAEVDLIAPNGAADIAAILWRGFDEAAFGEIALDGLKIRQKISLLLNTWLDTAAANAPLAHRLTGFLMLPPNLGLHRRLMWATADRVWMLAGDKALDENHYSKRAIVFGILSTALVSRLARGREAQLDQIKRNIDAVMAFETWKANLPTTPDKAVLQIAERLGQWRFGRRHDEAAT